MTETDWDASAEAWIGHLGPEGDRGRRYVLDPIMRMRLAEQGFKRALDVGCGEGRVCRMLAELGIKATGIDPTAKLIERAAKLDANGVYHIEKGEALPFEDDEFDLVVSCLS